MEYLLCWGTPGGLVRAVRAGGAGGDEAELGAPAGKGQWERDRGAGAGSCGQREKMLVRGMLLLPPLWECIP